MEKECLAIKLSIEYFKVYLLRRPFIIQTDNRSLVWLNKLKDKNSRLARWSLFLQPYIFKVKHRPGAKNGNAVACPEFKRLNPEKEGKMWILRK